MENARVCLTKLLEENSEILTMGDFSCKEVSWEDWTTEGSETSWGARLLELAIENILTQWVQDNTRFRGSNMPSRLDLVFTKDHIKIEAIKYTTPLGKSDHVLLEFLATESCPSTRKEVHKNEWLDYSKTNFRQLIQYFDEVDWSTTFQLRDIEEKWNSFLEIYNKGVERWVPKKSTRNLYKKEWYNKKCAAAKQEREKAWKRWKKNKRHDLWANYIRKRNEYVKTHRFEQKNYEKNIVDKCKDKPKLFYKYIN